MYENSTLLSGTCVLHEESVEFGLSESVNTDDSGPTRFTHGLQPVSRNVRHCIHRLSIGERLDNALNDVVEFLRGKLLIRYVEHATV